MKKIFRLSLPVFVILAMLLSSLPAYPAQAISPDIVISQVYGGGGNSGATYKNDFIELYNLGPAAVDVTGWSVQYGSSGGTTWTNRTNLSGVIEPGKYYLIQEAAGTGGTVNLPTPDAAGSIAMSGSAGKVALVNNTAALTGACPSGVVDFVGYGGANCSETAPTPALTNATAAIRNDAGCSETDNNFADFATGAPTPRNSSSPAHTCSGPTNPSGTGLAVPSLLFAGDSVLLTLVVSPGTNPASTHLAATCDLATIGGSAAQPLYDDGTNGDVLAADATFSYATTVTAGISAGVKSIACTITDGESRTGSTSISLTITAILPIGAVQGAVNDADDGATFRSPNAPASGNGAGQSVTIQGVIYEKTLQPTAWGGYNGFFIQNTAATSDADPNTSDGLYVFMSTNTTISGPAGSYTPAVGDEIVLSGTISEYYSMTELSNPRLVRPVVRSGVDLEAELAPFVANPPDNLEDANRYWERSESMRALIPAGSIILGGRSVFSPPDAEIWVANPDSTIAQRVDPYTRRAFRDAHPLDDNYDPTNWDGNGYRILMGSWGLKAGAGDSTLLIDPARTFDTLTNAPVGGVNFTFSKYRIEVTSQPELTAGADPAANNPPQAFDPSLSYSIVDYNLENLYDYRDNLFSGCDYPSDTAGCPRVAPFLAAVTSPYNYVPADDSVYQARLNDIASQIVADLHSPDILMVQEIENQDICAVSNGSLACGASDNADGKPDVLQELALVIAGQGGPTYDAAFDRDSSDLRGIAPAFLYRTDRVELLPADGDPVLGSAPALGYAGAAVPNNSNVSNPKTLNAVLPSGITACETSWVFPRAPGVALFRIYSAAVGEGNYADVYVINNHFKSGPDTCIEHRTEQAKYNAALVKFIEETKPGARIVVGGDLNVYPEPDDIAYGASHQLGSLYDPSLGLQNLWEVLLGQAPQAAYSYVYLGMAQTLDQMFINPSLLADLQAFNIAHINSDFPADYPGDVARGTSDHDPNMATFVINAPPAADAGGPYSVDEGSSITLTAAGADPEFGPLTYAWDLDNDGSFETPGQDVSFAGIDGPASLTVAVQVTDNGGLSAVATSTITVNDIAPTLGPITAPLDPQAVYTPVTVSADFTDPGVLDTHRVFIDWGDGSAGDGTVSELNGSGAASGTHAYAAPGFYAISMIVTDKDGAASNTATYEYVIVYDPNGGFVTGGGWINSPAGEFSIEGKAAFELSAKYKKGASLPGGEFVFQVKGFNFASTAYEWLVVAGKTAFLKGAGTVNSEGTYSFMLTVVDDDPDTFQLKIWQNTDAGEIILYDNGSAQPLGGGNISVKK